ncbi:MAG: SRPBCC family protein [Proteobacteria bacterium]|nr:SRPBCC family protein [Pseudomonadota bacterium]MBU4388517.1 SRPBCC family protein [Pseudomonadota bacterium]MBU4419992.1 SRPBCC family protein [Pseudomonadota bacterium]MBU4504572.1 SRPBCC family protein [Pseudomonadota bacterium]
MNTNTLFITIITIYLLLYPVIVQSATETSSDTLSVEKEKQIKGEIIVTLSNLENMVIGVTGEIYIGSQPEKVWTVLTDYDNLKNFIPNIIESGLLKDKGDEKIIVQTGRTEIFLFKKTSHIKLKVKEEYSKHIYFEQIGGDFKVYKGEWILEYYQEAQGTFLTFKSEVKPDFFAPLFITRYVQKRDLPIILEAIKRRVESSNNRVVQ